MGAGISDVELGSWKFFVSKVYTGLGGSGSDLASRQAYDRAGCVVTKVLV